MTSRAAITSKYARAYARASKKDRGRVLDREIADPQIVLLKLAKDKTKQLYLTNTPSAPPDIRAGIQIDKPKAPRPGLVSRTFPVTAQHGFASTLT
ncbi:MAG: hypothetical protein ACRC35_08495 [Angustibacter sp.]